VSAEVQWRRSRGFISLTRIIDGVKLKLKFHRIFLPRIRRSSSYRAQKDGYEKIVAGFGWTWPKPEKILTQGGVGDESSHIREGETGPVFDGMAAFGVGFDAIGIDPGNGSSHHKSSDD
jgi:hypothetical protein